jgi:hypothetical protein
MKLDYHGDSGIVEPHGNVRIQTQTPAQGILSAIAILRQQPFWTTANSTAFIDLPVLQT